MRLEEGTAWLSQRLMAELFQVSVPTIHEHLGNLFDEGEAEVDGGAGAARGEKTAVAHHAFLAENGGELVGHRGVRGVAASG